MRKDVHISYSKNMRTKKSWYRAVVSTAAFTVVSNVMAGEADIQIPDLRLVNFNVAGSPVQGLTLLYWGLIVCLFGVAFALFQYLQVRKLPVHRLMSQVSHTIWETCKTYLLQQGKFLTVLWAAVACCMAYYFIGLEQKSLGHLGIVLACSVLGILWLFTVWRGLASVCLHCCQFSNGVFRVARKRSRHVAHSIENGHERWIAARQR